MGTPFRDDLSLIEEAVAAAEDALRRLYRAFGDLEMLDPAVDPAAASEAFCDGLAAIVSIRATAGCRGAVADALPGE